MEATDGTEEDGETFPPSAIDEPGEATADCATSNIATAGTASSIT